MKLKNYATFNESYFLLSEGYKFFCDAAGCRKTSDIGFANKNNCVFFCPEHTNFEIFVASRIYGLNCLEKQIDVLVNTTFKD